MQFILTRSVKKPERNVSENAGIDCYIPDACEEFFADLKAKNFGLKFISDKLVRVDSMTNEVISTVDKADRIALAKKFGVSYVDVSEGLICIAPHKDIIIPSGIRSKFGPDIALIANNKSGIATKKKLVFGASVIDASYQGEWHYHLINTSDEFQTVECGKKVIQFIPHIISTEPVEVLDMTPEEFYTEKTSRGEGWQGSTGV